jgi:hypothetical protein
MHTHTHTHTCTHTHTHTRAHHECKHHRCTDEAQINVSFVSIGDPTGLALAAEPEESIFHTLAASTSPRISVCACVYMSIDIYQCMYAHTTHTHTQHTHTHNTHMHLYKLPPTSLHKSYTLTHTYTNVHFVRVSVSTCIATAPPLAGIAYCALHGGRVNGGGPKSRPVWVEMQCSEWCGERG